jgi:4-methyl-5(b-hydroxyethyl)-thiazole monophosphate biosynthesis
MPKVCVLLADGFEEIEAVTIIDVLRRAEVDVVALGVKGKTVQGAHGLKLEADKTLKEAAGESWAMVILPGGLPGATNLRDDPDVQALIKKQSAKGGKLAAICAAPIALGAAGILENRRATCYPGFEDQLAGARVREERVVADGNLITSRGPGTALEFALRLAAELRDEETAAALREGMLVTA